MWLNCWHWRGQFLPEWPHGTVDAIFLPLTWCKHRTMLVWEAVSEGWPHGTSPAVNIEETSIVSSIWRLGRLSSATNGVVLTTVGYDRMNPLHWGALGIRPWSAYFFYHLSGYKEENSPDWVEPTWTVVLSLRGAHLSGIICCYPPWHIHLLKLWPTLLQWYPC